MKETGGMRKLRLDPTSESSQQHSVTRYVNHLKSGNLCVPSTNFYLIFKDDTCFENQPVKTLSELCGRNITRLHLDHLTMDPMISKSLADFLEPLQNLAHLTIGCFLVKNMDETDTADENKISVPRTFKNLKSLTVISYQEPFGDSHVIWQFIEDCCQNLEYLAYPPLIPYRTPSILFTYIQEGVRCIIKLIEKRAREFPDQQNLQSLDLGRCQEPYWGRGYDDFFSLVRCCADNNVKILNLNSDFLKGRGRAFADLVSRSVTSIWGITGSMFLLHLPILEKLTIEVRNFSIPTNPILLQKWARVRELHLTIFSHPNKVTKISSQYLLDFIFVGETRAEMENLTLSFISRKGYENSILCPHPASMVATCPNLKHLSLEKWPGINNLDIAMLWTGLPLLETLSLINCPALDYVAFVGEDDSQPAFLQLKSKYLLKFVD